MIHLYFLLYCISLLSGVLWLVILFMQRANTPSEILDAYLGFFLSFTGLITGMSVIVYALINIGYSVQLLVLISVVVLAISSIMVFALERYTFSKLNKRPAAAERVLYLAPLCFLPITTAFALTAYAHRIFLAAVVVHLLLIYAVIIHTSVVSYRYECLPKSLRCQEILEGIICFAIVAAEFLFNRDFILNTGLFASLPLAYLFINIRLFLTREQRFVFFSGKIHETNRLESAGLTKKELEIAELVRKGYSNKEIAFELNISPHTVKNHIYNLFQKVHATSRIDFLQKTGQISQT
ncbi:MAG: helix-turn-helix transcriptional regulator [Spirochaetales bacterium]|nr:helix-turn-helix transcriptional regulator [Spirochaetales bacterium]